MAKVSSYEKGRRMTPHTALTCNRFAAALFEAQE